MPQGLGRRSLLLALPAAAAIIHVPADQPTIQTAIDQAVAGDTVLVAPGTYFENITMKSGVVVPCGACGRSPPMGTPLS